jgi:DNA ligase-associated metallophosphoesterase
MEETGEGDPWVMGNLTIELRGEDTVLLAERAFFWLRRRTLVAADMHLGKAASFRSFGIPMPGGTTHTDLERLSKSIEQTGARRLVLLGDLIHARAGRSQHVIGQVESWRARHAELEILHIRGNHDRKAGDPPRDWHMICLDEPLVEEPFIFRHYPEPSLNGYTLAGHVHPAVTMRGAGRQRERLPCFLIGEHVALLPAFGSFTGAFTVAPGLGDGVYVVADSEVLPFV